MHAEDGIHDFEYRVRPTLDLWQCQERLKKFEKVGSHEILKSKPSDWNQNVCWSWIIQGYGGCLITWMFPKIMVPPNHPF